MKKASIILGVISTVIIALAFLTRVQHWPGTELLIFLGLIIHMFGFLPLWAIYRAREAQGGLSKAVVSAGLIFLLLLYSAILLKALHWKGSGPMLVTALLFLLVVFLPMALVNIRRELNRNGNSLIMILIAAPLVMVLLSQRTPPYLNSLVIMEKRMNELYVKLDKENGRYYKPLETLTAEDIARMEPYFSKAARIQTLTKELELHINSVRAKIISETEEVPIEQADTLTLEHIFSKENYHTPTFILIGEDPSNPTHGKYTALELREKLNRYRSDLASLIDSPDDVKHFELNAALQTRDVRWDADGGMNETWENAMFYHMPLASVVISLNQLRIETKITEGKALRSLYDDAVEKNAIKHGAVAR